MDDAYRHDPYREVEMYLEQAQEEIGKAFADLEDYERHHLLEPSPEMISESPTSPIETPPEFSQPPSGDIEKLLIWADAFVQEINAQFGDTAEIDCPSKVPKSFRSLPNSRQHTRISSSFRRPTNPAQRRNHRKMWSWPHGCGDGPLSRGPRRRTRDAQVQTTDEVHSSVSVRLPNTSKYPEYESFPEEEEEELNDLKHLSVVDYFKLFTENEDDLNRDGDYHRIKDVCYNCVLTNGSSEDSAIEAPSNWKFKDMHSSRQLEPVTEFKSSALGEDIVQPSIGVDVTEEMLVEYRMNSHRESWTSTTVSSYTDEDECDLSNCFSPGGTVSSTISWLAAEDDSDLLECKELPKVAVRSIFDEDDMMHKTLMTQKSPSSTLSSVSRDELDNFLRKVASSVYQPPPEDGDAVQRYSAQEDAITQTSPDLSRSSSFTWVTECDCSDRPRTAPSQDSLPSFSDCTNSDVRETSSSRSSSSSSPPAPGPVQHTPWLDSSLSLSDVGENNPKEETRWCNSLDECAQGRRPVAPQLEFKSSSAPIVTGEGKFVDPDAEILKVLLSTQRSHSARQLTELEAIDACTWLRAAGFPQYAQMYEDNLFPIDIAGVRKDHEFLDPDAIQSLFRRLNTLNKCARIKSDGFPRKSVDESDEEDNCALSENWQFQRSSRRWSRILPLTSPYACPPSPKAPVSSTRRFLAPEDITIDNQPHRDNSRDSVFLDEPCLHSSPESLRKAEMVFTMGLPMDDEVSNYLEEQTSPGPYADISPLRRSRSERVKDGARAFLRGVESLKVKRKKNRDVVIIGGPAGDDTAPVVVTVDRKSPSPSPQSRRGSSAAPEGHAVKQLRQNWTEDSNTHSDSECPPAQVSPILGERIGKRRNGSISSLEEGSTPLSNREVKLRQSVKRTQWLASDATKSPTPDRRSLYDNVPNSAKSTDSACGHKDNPLSNVSRTNAGLKNFERELSSDADTPGSQDEMDIVNNERRDSGVGSSLTRQSQSGSSPVIQSRWHCFTSTTLQLPAPRSAVPMHMEINTLSVSQMMVLRKFSLLKLTALMEKYSPSNRAGWNWGVPKFIRRIRTPDYKDKSVFGIPLLLLVQRTGQPLPPPIQDGLNYLRQEGMQSQGIFRKSGVRSRIQTLRNQCESHPSGLSFENQQVYDVADLVKQYFRELPDALLTNKLSETFTTIFQYIPSEFRLEATQAAILLMPDENREALQTLLAFLDEVSQHSDENQMTAANLAVCLAPSLFHLSIPRSASASPRRRKTVGIPDQKDLNENKAAHTCLTTMISNYKKLFLVPEDTMLHCRLSSLDPCEPPSLRDLTVCDVNKGQQEGWKAYTESCIQELLKETREKFRNWVPVPPVEGVEVSYKKVGDGHPLKLWKVAVDVEAPPVELLNRILRERQMWDERLLKWQVVSKLEKQAEIFQYACGSMSPQPPREYVVLRSWKVDNAKGMCALVETSVDHSEATSFLSAVRGVVLTSQFLIEPCGSGKSRVAHICRVDNRGRSPEWYNKVYGHNSAVYLARLRDSFKQPAVGPETKV